MAYEYRVVRDRYSGFEAQYRRWKWWPFWFQCFGPNTARTLEAAEQVCHEHATKVVKYLGRLPISAGE